MYNKFIIHDTNMFKKYEIWLRKKNYTYFSSQLIVLSSDGFKYYNCYTL